MSALDRVKELLAAELDDRTCEHKEMSDKRIEMTCKECRRYERKRPYVALRKLEARVRPIAEELVASQ